MNAADVAYLETYIKDYTPDAKALLHNFRKWHVESLLNQAADLFDRALKDRTEYYELKAKWDLLPVGKRGGRSSYRGT